MGTAHIVVIGGGAAGTSAAYSLSRHGCRVTILEREARLGGRIYSQQIGDAVSELGAGFVTSIYKNVLAFLQHEGLAGGLQVRRSAGSLVRNNEVLALKNWRTIMGSNWFPEGGKPQLLRAGLQVLAAWPRLDTHDMWKAGRYNNTSAAAVFDPRLVDNVLAPVFDGYLYWSPETTSRAVAMVLLKAAIMQRRTYIVRPGLSTIPETAAKDSKVQLGCHVQRVVRDGAGYKVYYRDARAGHVLAADGVVCATTASAVPALFPELSPEQWAFFKGVRYSATVVAAGMLAHSTGPSRSFGFIKTPGVRKVLAAMTVLNDLSPTVDIVKLYASGESGQRLQRATNEAVIKQLTKAAPIDLSVAADWHVQRWPEALPVFDVTHLNRLRTFWRGEVEDQQMPLVFAGDYLGGPFIEGAFTSGQRAAGRLLARLGQN